MERCSPLRYIWSIQWLFWCLNCDLVNLVSCLHQHYHQHYDHHERIKNWSPHYCHCIIMIIIVVVIIVSSSLLPENNIAGFVWTAGLLDWTDLNTVQTSHHHHHHHYHDHNHHRHHHHHHCRPHHDHRHDHHHLLSIMLLEWHQSVWLCK